MENERPIEKLLRRYAKKRRDEARSPVEMHPATRRLLQGEVTRQFQKARNENTASAQRSIRWWPRLAYGLCALAVVTVAVVVFVPALTNRESHSLDMASVADRKEAESAPPLLGGEAVKHGAPPVQMAKNEVLESPALDESDRAKSKDDFGTMMTNSTTLAFADVVRPKDSVSSARERSKMSGAPAASAAEPTAPATTLSSMINADAVRFDNSNIYPATVEPALVEAGKLKQGDAQLKISDEAQGNYYAQNQTARFSNMDKSSSKMVLASFRVEQNGNDLRVIDNDGSTYNGNIVSAEVLRDTKSYVEYKKLEDKSAVMQKAARAVSGLETRQSLPAQNNFFRVSGTNKTLKQQVIFTGNIVAVTNTGQLQLPAINISNQAQNFPSQQALPLQFNNSIIVGRAQLEREMDIEVNAVPVAQ